MKGKITELISNVLTGDVFVKTIDNKQKKTLYKDKFGYFVYIDKQLGIVDRFTDIEDIKRINEFLEK